MLDKGRPDEEILMQLDAAKSSLGSTISTLISEIISLNEAGQVILGEAQTRAILRSVRKS